jgi:hypothetical protein
MQSGPVPPQSNSTDRAWCVHPGYPNGVVESDHRQRSHWGQAPLRVLRHPRPSSGSGSVSVSVSRSCALVVQDAPTGLRSQTTASGAIGDKRLCACCGIPVLHRGRGRYRYRYRGPARLPSRMPQRGNGMKPRVAAFTPLPWVWTSIHRAQPHRGCGVRPRPAGDSATPFGLTGGGVRSSRCLSPTAQDGRRELTLATGLHWRDTDTDSDPDPDPEPNGPDRPETTHR